MYKRQETASGQKPAKAKAIPQRTIFQAREEINQVHVSENMEQYIVDLVHATRFPDKFSVQLDRWIDYGASPRGSLSLEKCGRVSAWMKGADFVGPDDIRGVAHDVLRHRVVPSYEANADGIGKDQIIDELLKLVAVA